MKISADFLLKLFGKDVLYTIIVSLVFGTICYIYFSIIYFLKVPCYREFIEYGVFNQIMAFIAVSFIVLVLIYPLSLILSLIVLKVKKDVCFKTEEIPSRCSRDALMEFSTKNIHLIALLISAIICLTIMITPFLFLYLSCWQIFMVYFPLIGAVIILFVFLSKNTETFMKYANGIKNKKINLTD